MNGSSRRIGRPTRAGALAILALASVLAACSGGTGGQGSPTPAASAATATPAVPASPAAPSAVASPAPTPPTPAPATAAPAPSPSAASAALLVRLDVCTDACAEPSRIEYLADGRVITSGREGSGFLVRTLSADGLARVGDLLVSDSDLLGADLVIDPPSGPAIEPAPGHRLVEYRFIVPAAAGGRTTVRTVTSDSLPSELWGPDEVRDRLTALGDALLDPESLAGAGGWADAAWSPWTPAETAVFVHARETDDPTASPDLGPDGWPGGRDPTQLGEAFASPLSAWPVARCEVVSSAAAAGLAAGLPAGALSPADPAAASREGTIGWSDRSVELFVLFRVLLPDEEGLPCGDLWPYGA